MTFAKRIAANYPFFYFTKLYIFFRFVKQEVIAYIFPSLWVAILGNSSKVAGVFLFSLTLPLFPLVSSFGRFLLVLAYLMLIA